MDRKSEPWQIVQTKREIKLLNETIPKGESLLLVQQAFSSDGSGRHHLAYWCGTFVFVDDEDIGYSGTSADELFREIGYTVKRQFVNQIEYRNPDTRQFAEFVLYNKQFGVNGYIDSKLNKAIQRKLQELGWLE